VRWRAVSGGTPLVNKSLIARKLEKIETYLGQIRSKKDPGIKSFKKDKDLQSIILFNLIQAVQACIDMGAHVISDAGWETPSTQAEIFEILAQHKIITKARAEKMIRMAGFRNRIVHEYEKTDLTIVHAVWTKHSTDIETFCRAIIRKFNL
jgi:uncharacterized protein YutE (UPF0331/DUF86 family)